MPGLFPIVRVRSLEDPAIQNLRKKSPARPPDWRWERARLMRENARLASCFPKDCDKWVHAAKKYQLAYYECHDIYDLMKLLRAHPKEREAHILREDASDLGQLRRWELEARLLADDSLESIGKRLDIQPKVVACYEQLFFNVSDRLDSKGWVIHTVIGPKYHAGLVERDHDAIWKIFGFWGGPVALDVVVNKQVLPSRPREGDNMMAYVADDAKQSMALRCMVAARIAPVNSYTWQPLIELQQKFIELKNAEGGSTANDTISAHVKAMLESIPWTLGGHPRGSGKGNSPTMVVSSKDPSSIIGKLPPSIVQADQRGRELRADELHALSADENITWLDQPEISAFSREEEEESDDSPDDEQGSGAQDPEGA